MVDAHTRNHRSLPPELFFACSLPPIVLAGWVVAFAAGSRNIGLTAIAMLVGLAASAMSPMGLFIAVRARRLPHPAEERTAILAGLVGNALVVIQVVLILGALAVRP